MLLNATDMVPPVANAAVADVVAGGNPLHAFTVTYDDDQLVDATTIDDQDVLVTGPNDFAQFAHLVNTIETQGGARYTAIYRIDAPGGEWDATDNGVYTITLQPDQVEDACGNAAPAGFLGTFAVNANVVDLKDRFEQPESNTAVFGLIEGLEVFTNLNTMKDPAEHRERAVFDFYRFKMKGTGTIDDFVRIDYVRGEGTLSLSVDRQVIGPPTNQSKKVSTTAQVLLKKIITPCR